MKREHYRDWLLASLAVGAILGTAAVNLAGAQVREQAGSLAFLLAGNAMGKGRWELLKMAAVQRIGEVILLWGAGRTEAARLLCCLLAVYMGISVSAVMGVFTWENGLMGLPCYLASVLPQTLFYIPVWMTLAETAGSPALLRRKGLLAGALLLAAGICCEGLVSPRLFGGIFPG